MKRALFSALLVGCAPPADVDASTGADDTEADTPPPEPACPLGTGPLGAPEPALSAELQALHPAVLRWWALRRVRSLDADLPDARWLDDVDLALTPLVAPEALRPSLAACPVDPAPAPSLPVPCDASCAHDVAGWAEADALEALLAGLPAATEAWLDVAEGTPDASAEVRVQRELLAGLQAAGELDPTLRLGEGDAAAVVLWTLATLARGAERLDALRETTATCVAARSACIAPAAAGPFRIDGLDFMAVPSGAFRFGALAADRVQDDDETAREVVLTRPYLIAVHELTHEALRALDEEPANPFGCVGDCVTEALAWHDAARIANLLSAATRRRGCYTCLPVEGLLTPFACTARDAVAADCPGYRLPTEAEWEYAARAGGQWRGAFAGGGAWTPAPTACSQSARAYGRAPFATWAWTCQTTPLGARPPGQLGANPWGLHDVAGNVWEWCHDYYAPAGPEAGARDPSGPASGANRVLRGGGWFDLPATQRLSNRSRALLDDRAPIYGVRLVRTLDAEEAAELGVQ